MKFVMGEPALLLNGKLIISDTHIGVEIKLAEQGIIIPHSWEITAKKINKLLKKTKAKELVIVGDLKHAIMQNNPRIVEKFINEISTPIILVKGNHDARIEELKSKKLKIFKELIIQEKNQTFSLAHGHAWPSEKAFQTDFLIIGHEHPSIQFTGNYGYKWIEKAWIMGTIKKNKEHGTSGKQKVIIIPSFSDLGGVTPFNQNRQKIEALHKTSSLSPIIRNLVNLNECEAILLNGLNLGKIKNLKN